MGIIDTKVFQSGDDAAVLLPKDIAFAIDTAVTIRRDGDVVTIRPVPPLDPLEEKRKVSEFVAGLRELGPINEIERRAPYDFPERPGM